MERVRAGFDARRRSERILPASRAPGALFRVQWRETPVAARACFLLASWEHAAVVAVVEG